MWWMRTQLFFSPLLLQIPNSLQLSKPLTKECSQCFVLCILKNLKYPAKFLMLFFWHSWNIARFLLMLLSCILKICIQVLNIYPYDQVLDKTFHHHQTLKMDLKPFTTKLIWFVWGLFLCLLWMVQEGCFLGSRNHSWTSTRGSSKNFHIPLIVLCAWYSLLKDKWQVHIALSTQYLLP
jgi:hypothetical protein